MQHLLEVRNLTAAMKKKEKLFNAVDDVSFRIDEGEIVGLAGESGCGKSTVCLSIPGLLPQTAQITGGEIVYKGQTISVMGKKSLSGIRGKEISVIFQEPRLSLNPLLRIGKQITETLELAGSADRKTNKTKAVEMLEKLGFDEAEKIFDAYPHQLSGGMCQRVMTAIAAINNPRLLLADEPSSALDIESQERILSLLVEMNRSYKTSVLIISHDLSIIRNFCSRYMVMYAGKIIEEGKAESLFSPLHPYTKSLVNAIPDKSKRGKKLESISGKVPSIEDFFPGCPFAPRCKKTHEICKNNFPIVKETADSRVFCHFPHTGEADE